MSAGNIILTANGNGQSNGNGVLSIRNEVDKTETSALTGKHDLLQKLFRLVRGTTNNSDMETRKADICHFLETNPGICNENIKNENIFHCLAENNDQSSELLSLFGICSNKAAAENPLGAKPFTKYVTEIQLKELLEMPRSSLKQLPIHIAVENGNAVFVKEILILFPAFVLQVDSDGCTPLHYAARSSIAESLECTNVLLEVMQNENLTTTILRTKTIETEDTPVHIMCSNVPTSESAAATKKLKAILLSASSSDSNEHLASEILKTYNKEGFTPLHLLCKRKEDDIQTNAYGDVFNRYWLMRAMFEFLDSSDLTTLTRDSENSILHLVVNSELPVLFKFFLQKVDAEMFGKRDKNNKTVFHCAAENCIRPVKQQCLKLLVDWKTFEAQFFTNMGDLKPHEYFCHSFLLDTVEHTFNGKLIKNTALTLACKSKSMQSVELILRNMYFANPHMEDWFISKSKDQYIHSLKEVYEYTPGALVFLFNKSVTIDMKNSNENVLEFTADLSVIEALHSPSGKVGTQYLESADSWPDHVQEKLLLHSLTHFALEKVWKTELRMYKIIWLILNVAWVGFHMILVPLKCVKHDLGDTMNETTRNFTQIDCSETKEFSTDIYYEFGLWDYVAAWSLFGWTWIYVFSEFYVFHFPFKTFSYIEACIDICQVMLAFCIAFTPCLHSLGIFFKPQDFLSNCSAIGAFLAGLQMFQNMAVIHLPFGKWIAYIIEGTIKIISLMVLASPLITGFIYAYRQIFPKVFTGFLGDLGAILAMTAGDTNYAETFHHQTNWNNGGIIKTMFFVMFLAIFPMTYMSISLGIIFDKIKEMKKKLDVLGMSSHIRLTNHIQRTLVCKIELVLPCIFKQKKSSQVKWFIEWNKKHGKFSAFRCSFFSCCEPDSPINVNKGTKVLCGNGLPKIVKKGLHALYLKKAKEQRALNMKIDHE